MTVKLNIKINDGAQIDPTVQTIDFLVRNLVRIFNSKLLCILQIPFWSSTYTFFFDTFLSSSSLTSLVFAHSHMHIHTSLLVTAMQPIFEFNGRTLRADMMGYGSNGANDDEPIFD